MTVISLNSYNNPMGYREAGVWVGVWGWAGVWSEANSSSALRDPMDCSTPGSSILQHLWIVTFVSTEQVMLSNHLFSVFPPPLCAHLPSIRVFSNKSSLCIRRPKYWSFNISPSNEYSGLISFRIDYFDLLEVQGTLKSLLQNHSSKASILQHSHPYMTTGETITLTRWTCVGKVVSPLFNMLSRFVIAFLLRSKNLLNSWLQSPSGVILESKKLKSVTVSIVSPPICHEVMGPDAMILVF